MDLGAHYKGIKTLITGGCSFIGSHLAERLVALGSVVTVVDDLSSGKIDNIQTIVDRIRFIKGDLRDITVALQAVDGQSVVFHLANIHGGRGFIETHPAEISQNMIIDGNIFRAAAMSGIRSVCYISSACVYPTNLQTPGSGSFVRFLEEHMADPFKPGCAMADGVYGWGKLMGEMALNAFHKQYGLKGVSCRLFTTYGPRENESHAIIAFMAKALMRQDPFEIWGSGKQDRNFTFVDDIVEGCLRASAVIDNGSAINIGTDEILSVFDAAKTICELVPHRPSQFFFDTSKPEGVTARAASVELQQKVLGWRPKTTFAEGVRKTMEWYQSHRNLEDLHTASLTTLLFER